MLIIEWKRNAVLDFIEILDYISQRNPNAAEKIENIINEAVEKIADSPYSARTGRVIGTRKKIAHPNYIIVYRVLTDKIEIVNIIHARRNYPDTYLYPLDIA